MTELHEVGDDAEAAIPWAKGPDVTIICDIDNGRGLRPPKWRTGDGAAAPRW